MQPGSGRVQGNAGGYPEGDMPPEVEAYDELFTSSLGPFIETASKVGDDVKKMSETVVEMINAIRRLIIVSSKCSKPDDSVAFSDLMETLQECHKKNDSFFRSKFVNVNKSVHEALDMLTWPTMGNRSESFAGDMLPSVQCYTNKILMECRDSDPNQAAWANSLIGLLKPVKDYINDYHKGGIKWCGGGPKATEAMFSGSGCAPCSAQQHAPSPTPSEKPSQQLPVGRTSVKDRVAAINSRLSQKESDQRQAPPHNPAATRKAPPAPAKPKKEPSITNVNHNITIANFEKQVPKIGKVQIEDMISIHDSDTCEFNIEEKCKGVVLTNLRNCSVTVKDVVGPMEVVNCKKMHIYLEGRIPYVSLDACENAEIYLSESCLDVKVATSRCLAVNLEYPVGDGDYTERGVPERIISQFNEKKELVSSIYKDE